MISDIERKIEHSAPFRRLLEKLGNAGRVTVTGTAGCSRIILIHNLRSVLRRPVLLICTDDDRARLAFDDLCALDEDGVNLFPALDRHVWSEVGPLSATVGHRLSTLKSMFRKEPRLIVASMGALLEKVADPSHVAQNRIQAGLGDEIDFERFVEFLIRMGFVREQRVDRPGEISIRGGLVDLFPFEEVSPIRIEFFGDRIETIRSFDVETQRSQSSLDRIEIIQQSAAGPFGPYDEHPIDTPEFDSQVLDYAAANTVIAFEDLTLLTQRAEDYHVEMNSRFESFQEEHNLDALELPGLYIGVDSVSERWSGFSAVDFATFAPGNQDAIDFAMTESPRFNGRFDLFGKELSRILGTAAAQPSLVMLCDSAAQESRLRDLLPQEGIPQSLVLHTLNLSTGFYWPDGGYYVYTNRELFSRPKLPRPDQISSRNVSLNFLTTLNKGDYVVHEEHGIGVYRGLEKITAYNRERECLKIEYQEGDTLYVPLEKMDKVGKYSSRENIVPQLSKLGSANWEKSKSRTKKRIKEIAEQLIKLYAMRKMRRGHAFGEDTVWQKELEASFSFEETLDQLSAIEDVKNDMESDRPMDRLICGDVGYGKTEVAIRVAFKAINDGKQVALLVPTTILAQQHFSTFSERLAPFPVKIAMLSRFKSAREQKEILAQVRDGRIDFVVGTHRLLSKDVSFKDLGLLIVDEEQKFGVLHKERLKLLRETVDTLTLSATPIPRTMHMALISAKDMSIINTPPSNRMPIKTEVCRFDRDYIREIMLREYDRGGQIFFVHNRVQTIHNIAGMLRQIVPEISFGVAHGQMDARELERVMQAFTERKIACLICTMIIESGIDMPNANTLIVNRADRFGLSQLYQLRGRVGRADQQAFAYLLIPSIRKLKRTAIKRLQTIQELTQLGSGYKVAMRDLEIRGAGNIFGAQQSGYIDALGFDLYNKIIEEAVLEIKNEVEGRSNEKPAEVKVDVDVNAFLPDDYVVSASERVDIYRRLIEARDAETIAELKTEIEDRFGPTPQPAQNLFDYLMLKHHALSAGLSLVTVRKGRMSGRFARESVPDGERFKTWLGYIIERSSGHDKFNLRQEGDDLEFELTFAKGEPVLEGAKKFLHRISE